MKMDLRAYVVRFAVWVEFIEDRFLWHAGVLAVLKLRFQRSGLSQQLTTHFRGM